MELAPANTNPFETNRLLVELSTYHGKAPKGRRTSEQVKEVATRIISGDLQGALWLKQPDAASGVAVIEPTAGAGVKVPHLYLEKPYQTAESVTAFVEGLQEFAKEHGGVYAFCDEIPGLDHAQQSLVFEPKGFRHVGRETMVFHLGPGAHVADPALPLGRKVRVGIEQVEGLISLFAQTYEGEHDQLFAPKPGDSRESGRAFLEDFFLNVDVPTVPWGSFGIEKDGEILAAVLTQREYMAPPDSKHLWVYDLMVAPDYQGKGMGSYLLSELLREAQGQGFEEVFLEVTEGNPAGRLYSRFGFEKVPTHETMRRGLWVNTSAAQQLGIPL